MKLMQRVSLILSLAAMVMLFTGVVSAAEYKEMTIRAATANPDGSLHVEAINKFKEIVERESNGAIKVQTFYGGSMGDEQANVKQLRNAEINLAVLACGNLTPFAPSAGVFYLPYLFPSLEDAEKLFSNDEFMEEVAGKVVAESRTRPLAWLIGGYRVITNAQKPIRVMEDLQGLKIRVPPVELQLAAFRSWGVEPHPLAWSETFNGLQQGVIHGQENPHAINRDQKFWEVQKYITNVHYLLWVGPISVSEKWYRKLDPQTKALVKRAAQEAAQHEWTILGLILVEILTGIAMVYLDFPFASQPLHLVLASLLFGLQFYLVLEVVYAGRNIKTS